MGSYSFGFGFLVCHISDVDGVFGFGVLYLAFVELGASDGECRAVVGEAEGGDCGIVAVELAETLLVEPVPDVHVAVGATRRKRVVHRVEAYRIYGVDLF